MRANLKIRPYKNVSWRALKIRPWHETSQFKMQAGLSVTNTEALGQLGAEDARATTCDRLSFHRETRMSRRDRDVRQPTRQKESPSPAEKGSELSILSFD